MAFVNAKSATFLIRKERFDSESLGVIFACKGRGFHVGDQVYRFFIIFGPPPYYRHRAIFFICKENVLGSFIGARRKKLAKNTGFKLFTIQKDFDVIGRPTNISPSPLIQSALQFGSIKLAITQENNLWGGIGKHIINLLCQCDMAAFRSIQSVGFLRHSKLQAPIYPNVHNYTFFGAQYRACTLDPSGFGLPFRSPVLALPADFTTNPLAKL